MTTTVCEALPERTALLESLESFRRGTSEAPMVTKWPHALSEGGAGDEEPSTMTFVLYSNDVDRHGDVISTDDWVLDSHQRNPVFLWVHDYRRPAIGRAERVWREPHRLLANMKFAPTEFMTARSQPSTGPHSSGESR